MNEKSDILFKSWNATGAVKGINPVPIGDYPVVVITPTLVDGEYFDYTVETTGFDVPDFKELLENMLEILGSGWVKDNKEKK